MQFAFIGIFALVWSTFVLRIDISMAGGTFKQFASRHYAVASGQVTHSEVKTHHGSKGGISYEAVINYSYEVGNRGYTGKRLRYNSVSANSASAQSLVQAHPVGSAVPVFYNPADPQDSLLQPGLVGADLFMFLFLAPFNAVMIGFWIWLGTWLRERLFRPPAGGVTIIRDRSFIRVRLPQTSAVFFALLTVGGLGFVSVFIVAFSTRMQASIELASTAVALVYLSGVAVYLRQRQKLRSGIDDLIIDQAARTLELPPTCGRKQPLATSTTDVAGLTVEQVVHTSSKGGISYTYAPTLRLRGANSGAHKLADWSDQLKANDFTNWLRQQIGL